MSDEILVELYDEGTPVDADEVDRLTLALRRELLDIDDVESVSGVSAGPAPPGTRGLDIAALGALAVTVRPTVDVLVKVSEWCGAGWGVGRAPAGDRQRPEHRAHPDQGPAGRAGRGIHQPGGHPGRILSSATTPRRRAEVAREEFCGSSSPSRRTHSVWSSLSSAEASSQTAAVPSGEAAGDSRVPCRRRPR